MSRHNQSRRIQYMQRCDWYECSLGWEIHPPRPRYFLSGMDFPIPLSFWWIQCKVSINRPFLSSTRSVHCKVVFLTVLDFVPVAVAALTLPLVAVAALALPLHSKHGGTHHCHCWLTMDNHQHQRHSNQCQHQHQHHLYFDKLFAIV